MKDYYRILQVNRSASESEIKTAYRKLAMKYHPDRNAHPDAHSVFLEITEAYEYLIDPNRHNQSQYNSSQTSQHESASANHADPYYHRAYTEEEREAMRQRAYEHARQRYEEYKKTAHYRFYSGADKFINVAVVAIGLACIILPWYNFVDMLVNRPKEFEPPVMHVLATVFGLLICLSPIIVKRR